MIVEGIEALQGMPDAAFKALRGDNRIVDACGAWQERRGDLRSEWGVQGCTLPDLALRHELSLAEVVASCLNPKTDARKAVEMEAQILGGALETCSVRTLARSLGGDLTRMVKAIAEAHGVDCRGRQAA
jgi:hypothetical protein